MSEENLETVRRAFAALERRDMDAWLGYWTEDVDYRAMEGAPDDHGPMHGRADIRAYVQDWIDMFEDFRSEPVELIDAGEDTVVVVHAVSGTAKQSGIETEMTYAAVYSFRDGKVCRGREYATREEALEAARVLQAEASR
jgi:ketosteroid isomerase-like protein